MDNCFNCGAKLPQEISDGNMPYKRICPTCGVKLDDENNHKITPSNNTISALSSGLLAFNKKKKNIF